MGYKSLQHRGKVLAPVIFKRWIRAGVGGRGGGLLGLIFAGYVPLASQSPYPIIVYFCGQL